MVLPLPDVLKGPLQMGHTNNSNKRLSIPGSLRRSIAVDNFIEHDVHQSVRFAALETCGHRHVPMPLAGERRTFYGIFLGHEHRLVIAEVDVGGGEPRVIGERSSAHLDAA
jgi:hypothetical protein